MCTVLILCESERCYFCIRDSQNGSNKTNVWQEILTPSTLAFSCKVVHKIYENLVVDICKI